MGSKMPCPPLRHRCRAQKPWSCWFLQPRAIAPVAILTVCLLPFLVHAVGETKSPKTQLADNQPGELARLSADVSVRAAGRGNPSISLSDGHDLLTSYIGPNELRQALEQNLAKPRSLATADFDEDGVPDLVSGYSYNGQGIVTLLRGNVDAIYPNAPEAQQRKANGTFTTAPFLSPARVFDAPVGAEFIGAGEFDADGHWDVVIGSRARNALYLFSGNCRGDLSLTKEISLPGVVTAMTTGEIDRRDGLTDIVVGIDGQDEPKVMVFEGPEGALRAEPEVFDMPAQVAALALGQLDNEYTMDLAVSAGDELVIVHGRDRKLSLDETERAKVSPALVTQRKFPSNIASLVLGNFTGDSGTDVALLMDDGAVSVLSSGDAKAKVATRQRDEEWPAGAIRFKASHSSQLICARISSSPHDDLLITDAVNNQLHVLRIDAKESVAKTETISSEATSLDVARAPVAVLPMRLTASALYSVTLLTKGQTAPVIAKIEPNNTFVVTNTNATGPGSLQFAILDANETPGADLISFNIPGPGPFTITQSQALPTITDPITIDGTSQPGYAGTPIIQLRFTTAEGNGVIITAGSSTVRGLDIGVTGGATALGLQTNGNNIVESNHFTGSVRAGSSNNRIGGTTAAARNLLAFGSSSTFVGAVQISGGVQGNLIQGNFIGTDSTGTIITGSGDVLIEGIFGPQPINNTVGGTLPGARNIISGSFRGVRILVG